MNSEEPITKEKTPDQPQKLTETNRLTKAKLAEQYNQSKQEIEKLKKELKDSPVPPSKIDKYTWYKKAGAGAVLIVVGIGLVAICFIKRGKEVQVIQKSSPPSPQKQEDDPFGMD